MSYLDDYLKAGTSSGTGTKYPGDPAPSLYTSSYTAGVQAPTFDAIDAKWAGTTPPTSGTTTNTTRSSGSVLNDAISTPTGPSAVAAPTYDQSLRNMYVDTFNNPNAYWDEYSQGQGVQFTNNAARGMAKAGRTGMLPALNTMAHQDYMSNYLPSVRKDMAPGLSYESAWNQTQGQQYGDELSYSQGIYGQEVARYGHELDYDHSMTQLAETARSNKVREGIDLLNAELRNLEISENTKVNLARDLTTIFKDVSEAEQRIIMDQLLAGIGIEGYGAKTLEELLADSSPADSAYSKFYDNYVG